MKAATLFTLSLTVVALCFFFRAAVTRALISSKVSSSFSAETMLPLRLRLWFLLGKPELEAELEAPAEPVPELDDDSMNLICLLTPRGSFMAWSLKILCSTVSDFTFPSLYILFTFGFAVSCCQEGFRNYL